MPRHHALAGVALLTVLAACSSGGAAGQATPAASLAPSSAAPPASTAPSAAVPSASASSQPAPSTSAIASGDDCDARKVAATGAQNTMVLAWETISYQVKSDRDWKANAGKGDLDIAKYRAAVELVADLPDITYPGRPDFLWSAYVKPARDLGGLLAKAEASSTPFKDGIGDRIRKLAADLRAEGMWAIYGAVDGMCDDPADHVSAGGVDALLAKLTPPHARETSRRTSPTFSLFEFESADAIAALVTFYEGAIPAAGLTLQQQGDIRGGQKYLTFIAPGTALQGDVHLEPGDAGRGNTVKVTFTGG